jgi:glycosyltransferase involved in cell wall biosynthesis
MEAIQIQADQGENPFRLHGQGPHLVAVGRLSFQKGFDRLIKDFPFLLAKKQNARLWILGKGEREKDLRELINQLGLEEKVFLAGFQQNPFQWLKHADLFVLSSRFEGLPNTLLEALSCGCPVVALHHPGGTEEILKKLGLIDRYVPSLEVWPASWWERPMGSWNDLLINNFSMLKIVEEYEDLLIRGSVKKT